MDAVPWKFVDAVVELFGRKTLDELAEKVCHPLWKNVVDLHHRNRVYYEISFRLTADGMQHFFKNAYNKCDILKRIQNTKGRKKEDIITDALRNNVDLSINTRTIRGKGRFARIVGVDDSTTDNRNLSYWRKVEPLWDEGTTKLLETVAPLIDPVSASFRSNWGSTDCTRVLLTSLFKRVYLQEIRIPYCGQIAYDFLEDQINNSHFLSHVTIDGQNWPKCTVDLVTKFCLKGRPGKLVRVSPPCGIYLDRSYIQNLLDLWKVYGTLHFMLCSYECIVDKKGIRALMSKGQVRRDLRGYRSFFQHETEKSVAILSNDDCLMKCYTCECDKFKKCLLKAFHPEFHKF
uniref:F-box domain-containing protein n=1 Tax=Steinernema glaseri TaxID=37863 RepID=A0A1I7Y1M8_9BILA